MRSVFSTDVGVPMTKASGAIKVKAVVINNHGTLFDIALDSG